MTEREFIFRLSAYDTAKLLPQTRKALKTHTEMLSRECCPRLWKATDALNAKFGGDEKKIKRSRITSVVYLALGLFLFMPGLMKGEELTTAMFAGAFAMAYGLGGLWTAWKKRKDPFEQAARILLEGKDALPADNGLEVSFSEQGMMLPKKQKGGGLVPYGAFVTVVETADLYLLVYDERVTALQKKDLAGGAVEEFRAFLSERVERFSPAK